MPVNKHIFCGTKPMEQHNRQAICDLIADVGITENNGFTFSELSEPTDITNELWK